MAEFEYGEDAQRVVELRMGVEEASMLASGIGFVVSDLAKQAVPYAVATLDSPVDEIAYLRLLEHRMVATQIYRGIWGALGIPEEEIDDALDQLDYLTDEYRDQVIAEHDALDQQHADADKEIRGYMRRQRWLTVGVLAGIAVNTYLAIATVMAL